MADGDQLSEAEIVKQAKRVILNEMARTFNGEPVRTPADLLRLAEAYAWMVAPGNAHGGSANPGK